MDENRTTLKGFPLSFNIYAESAEEAEECRKAIVTFITLHATQCRAVTARKVTEALRNWDKNAIVKRKIIDYFKQ